MKLPISLHVLVVGLMIAAGLALFATALQGVAHMDTSLEMAAARSAPDPALVQETGYDCPAPDRHEDV